MNNINKDEDEFYILHPIRNIKNLLSIKTKEIRSRYKLLCDKINKTTGW